MCVLLQACHHVDLLRTTHKLEDRVSERTWLNIESRIRYATKLAAVEAQLTGIEHSRVATYLTLLDCAFLFFRGIPLRILSSEIEGDFPCDEAVFDAEHPFAVPQFTFERSIRPRQAFMWLFSTERSRKEQLPDLIMLDTFVLIHSKFLIPQSEVSCSPRTVISAIPLHQRHSHLVCMWPSF